MPETVKTPGRNEENTKPGRKTNWPAAILAGLIGSGVFMMLEITLVPLFLGGSSWEIPRRIAAIVLGQGVLPPPATFDVGVLITATILHFLLSIVYAVILVWFIERWNAGVAILAGALFGLVLYVVNVYVLTAFLPWFAEARNWVTMLTHIVFGVVAAGVYKGIGWFEAKTVN